MKGNSQQNDEAGVIIVTSDSEWDLIMKEWNPSFFDRVKFLFNPHWRTESSYNPGKDKVYLEAQAYDPTVKIKNEIFPRPHEVYNCTTCSNANPEHPAVMAESPETFHVLVKASCPMKLNTTRDKQFSDGPRWNDIGCKGWDARELRPRKGYTVGIDI